MCVLKGVSEMIQPNTRDVLGFLWAHLERDVKTLGRILDQNMDDTAVTVHLILHTFTESGAEITFSYTTFGSVLFRVFPT